MLEVVFCFFLRVNFFISEPLAPDSPRQFTGFIRSVINVCYHPLICLNQPMPPSRLPF